MSGCQVYASGYSHIITTHTLVISTKETRAKRIGEANHIILVSIAIASPVRKSSGPMSGCQVYASGYSHIITTHTLVILPKETRAKRIGEANHIILVWIAIASLL